MEDVKSGALPLEKMVWSEEELMKLLQCTIWQLDRMRLEGGLRYVTAVRGVRLYLVEDIIEFLRRCRKVGSSYKFTHPRVLRGK